MRIDAHCDTSVRLLVEKSLRMLPHSHIDYSRLAKALEIQFCAIFFDARKSARLLPDTLLVLQKLKADIENNNDLIKPLLWRHELDGISREGISRALFAVEGGELLSGEITVLESLFTAGIRSFGLTWNYENELGGGANSDTGLTGFGAEVIAELNRLGIIVDGAHLSTQAFGDMLAVCKKPPVVSHTCCRALFEHRRNLDDKQLKALGESGGVAGITFVRSFLDSELAADIGDIVRHLDHAIKKAGIEHVGIGSDFDGTDLPAGMDGVQDWHKLSDGLRALGYGSSDIALVTGGNFYRILQDNLPEMPNKI